MILQLNVRYRGLLLEILTSKEGAVKVSSENVFKPMDVRLDVRWVGLYSW